MKTIVGVALLAPSLGACTTTSDTTGAAIERDLARKRYFDCLDGRRLLAVQAPSCGAAA